jgi:multiple sugar transport system substrate-binding protein
MKNNAFSRRQFLKYAGVAGAAYSVFGSRTFSTAQNADKTINVLTVGDPFDFALQKIATQFTEQTGIGVNLESLAYSALHNRLINSFVTGTSDADVITVDQMWLSQYSDNGWIISLDDYIKADADTNMDDFMPEVLYSLNTWRGHVKTLPIAAYAQGVIYRKDLLEQAGLEAPPKDPANLGDWTWEKYLSYVGELSKLDNTFGTVIVGSQPVPVVHMYTQLAASYGARWFTQFPEGKWDFTPTMNSDANKAALAAYKQLYDLSPPEAINYVWFDAGTRFSQGDIGMFFWWTPYFYLVKNDGYMTGTASKIMEQYDTALLPSVTAGGPNTVSLGGWSLGIPGSSSQQDEAWQFIKWATGAEAQKAMALVPDFNYQFSDFSRKTNYEDADLQKLYPYLSTQQQLLKMGNGKISRPPVPVYTSLEAVYGLQINQVLSGADPAAALETTNTLFSNILSGNQFLPYEGESYDDTLENTVALIDSLK